MIITLLARYAALQLWRSMKIRLARYTRFVYFLQRLSILDTNKCYVALPRVPNPKSDEAFVLDLRQRARLLL